MATNPQAVAKALLRAVKTQPDAGLGGFGSMPGTVANTVSPLLATYDAWSNGRAPSAGLPRDAATFLTGGFGPLTPMVPSPLDPAETDSGRPEPRRWQYQSGWNMPIGQPGDEGLKLASFAQLRTVADAYSVARSCIQVRIQEILGLEWMITPTKETEKKLRGDTAGRRDFDERRAKVVKFFKRPDPNYFGFGSWLSTLLEDVLAVDAVSLYLHPTRVPGKGLMGSSLAALDVIDGTTIRPLLDVQGGHPLPPNPAYQQYLYGVPRSDLMTVLGGEDVADMGDAHVKQYRGDQLLYLPYVRRDWTPYGFPPIERALVPILSGLQRQQFQLNYFSEGSVPGLFISAGDENASPNQLRELQDALNAMAGDPAWKHKIIVLPKNSKIDPMRPVALADAFDEIIMTQVCMAFDVMPMELGISPKVSTTQSSGAANQMAKASKDTNARKALKPLLKWLKEIFDHIIQDVAGQTDMQWTWEALEEHEDEETQVNLLIQEITHGLRSIDEARVIRGEQPWGLPLTSDPVYFTATGLVPIGAIDPNTGQTATDQPADPGASPPAAGTPEPPPEGGAPAKPKKPKGPKPKPAGGSTPAHSGAAAHSAETANTATTATETPKPAMAGKGVDAFAALRELDLIRRRIAKGRGVEGWTPESIPTDVFDRLRVQAQVDGEEALARARRTVKALGRGQRRDRAVAEATHRIATGLRHLADDLAAGTVSAANFTDRGVETLRVGIRAGMAAGAQHALADLGHGEARVGKSAPDWVESYDSRFFLYGEQARTGYEESYGLTTVASGTGQWLARWDATSLVPCDLCEDRDGRTFNIGAIPGFPGMGGYGELATVCRGGPSCHCQITYIHTPDETPGGTAQTEPESPAVHAIRQERATSTTAARQALAAALPNAVDGTTAPADPDAYERFLDRLAATRAEGQRQYLQGLLQDLLASAGAAATEPPTPVGPGGDEDGIGGLVTATVIAAGVAAAIAAQSQSQQQAAPATQPPPEDTTAVKGASLGKQVHRYLSRHYPKKVLGWVKDAEWSGPRQIDLADIDMGRRPGGRDPGKVKAIAAAVADGKAMDPVVLVKTPDGLPYQIADGYHRTLGHQHADKTSIKAWVGEVDTTNGPWDRRMHDAKLNKLADADLLKVGPKGYIHGWIYVGPQAVGAQVFHPQHGHGTVTAVTDRKAHVRFASGKEHHFDVSDKPAPTGDHFQPRLPDSVQITEHSSGRLHVNSPYDKAFITGVKNLDGKWLPKSKTWSVPADRAEDLQKLALASYGTTPESVNVLPTSVSVSTRGNGKIQVSAPFNDGFIQKARELGGSWDRQDKTWVFPPHRQQQVRVAIAEHYDATWEKAQRDAAQAKQAAQADLRSAEAARRADYLRSPVTAKQAALIRKLAAKHVQTDAFFHDALDWEVGPAGAWSADGPTGSQLDQWISGMTVQHASAVIDDLIAYTRGY